MRSQARGNDPTLYILSGRLHVDQSVVAADPSLLCVLRAIWFPMFVHLLSIMSIVSLEAFSHLFP